MYGAVIAEVESSKEFEDALGAFVVDSLVPVLVTSSQETYNPGLEIPLTEQDGIDSGRRVKQPDRIRNSLALTETLAFDMHYNRNDQGYDWQPAHYRTYSHLDCMGEKN